MGTARFIPGGAIDVHGTSVRAKWCPGGGEGRKELAMGQIHMRPGWLMLLQTSCWSTLKGCHAKMNQPGFSPAHRFFCCCFVFFLFVFKYLQQNFNLGEMTTYKGIGEPQMTNAKGTINYYKIYMISVFNLICPCVVSVEICSVFCFAKHKNLRPKKALSGVR